MKKLRPGDLFELQARKGLVYYQYTNDHPFGPIVRVLPGEYRQRPKDLSALAAGPSRFVLISPVGADLRNNRIVLVANLQIPEQEASMPVFRDRLPSPSGSLNDAAARWAFEIGGKRTTIPEGRRAEEIPIRLIAGAIAIARLVDKAWDGKSLPASDQNKVEQPAYYFLICETRSQAESVAQYLSTRHFFDIHISDAEGQDDSGASTSSLDGSRWTVIASYAYRGIESIESAERVMDEAVSLYGVTYDGNEVPAP